MLLSLIGIRAPVAVPPFNRVCESFSDQPGAPTPLTSFVFNRKGGKIWEGSTERIRFSGQMSFYVGRLTIFYRFFTMRKTSIQLLPFRKGNSDQFWKADAVEWMKTTDLPQRQAADCLLLNGVIVVLSLSDCIALYRLSLLHPHIFSKLWLHRAGPNHAAWAFYETFYERRLKFREKGGPDPALERSGCP